MERELPQAYGDTKLVLLVRDPEWIYAYWEISPQIRHALGLDYSDKPRRFVMRFYDITGVTDFIGFNANAHYDIEIDVDANAWYVHIRLPDRRWCADLGLVDHDDDFIQIVRSNKIETPANFVSDALDEHWMAQDEEFRKVLGQSAHLLESSVNGEKRVSVDLGGRSASISLLPSSGAFGGSEQALKRR
ncbi:DUF4912 domain-containing protein [Candidatus Sumerlaeota bacterium]|nr:DUF4912 domain-containing protein [Candidatus Sumerlaeota bacterium]